MKRFILSVLSAGFVFCATAADQLNVVATLPDLAAVAAAVGGPQVKITTLAAPTEDPHFVDPKPSFARVLNRADLLLEGGAELEAGWLDPLVEGARNPRILPGKTGRLAGSMGMELKEKPARGADRSQGDIHPAGNPHYLMDPLNAVKMAAAIANRFSQLDPASAAKFKSNAAKFNTAINEALADWNKRMEAARGTKVITYHRTFPYFLDRFGLELFDTIEPKPGVEPSPSHITSLIKTAKEAGVKMILIEGNRSRRTPDRIAKEIGATVVVLEHMPDPSKPDAYLHWIAGMVEAVTKGNKGS